jgi:threonylcarbamoyladenosine tRNA methylthiotransferase MtaB
VRGAAAEGAKEIVITGVNIGDFGKTTGETFIDLIRALDRVEGIERYRISSIEPNLLTDEVIEFVAQSRAFMPHFHIPLQAGSDAVLKLMRRRYDTALFASKIAKIRTLMPDAFIGVDVIVGTRGEVEEYFDEAYRFVDSLDITALHVFSYSERPGTQALKIEYKVTPQEKHRRSERLLALSDAKQRAFYERHIGKEAVVLLEKPKAGQPFHGFTDNYIRVEVSDPRAQDNALVRVRLGDFNEEGTALMGEMLAVGN